VVALRANEIPFEEVFIRFYTNDKADKTDPQLFPRGQWCALIDGDVTVWDSLSIIEYLARNTRKRSCGRRTGARGACASISSEMHSASCRAQMNAA